MSRKKIRIRIQGHGTITLKFPKKLTRKTYADGVAQAVAKALTLQDPPATFHPVMGYLGDTNGHDGTQRKAP